MVHYLLNRFIKDGLIRKDHYVVTSVRIKQSEIEIEFAELLHDMARRCHNVFSNTEIVIF